MEAFQCHGSNVGPMGTMRKGSGSVTGGVPFLACPDVSPAIKARDFKGPGSFVGDSDGAALITHTLRAEGHDASEDGTGRGVPIVPVDLQNTTIGGDVAGTVDCSRPGRGGGQAVMATFSGQGVRRLMPHELERLQGFPDDYTRIPYRGKSAEDRPDGPRAKALGNSMAVPVMRWIGERIHQVNGVPSHARAVGSQSTQAHR